MYWGYLAFPFLLSSIFFVISTHSFHLVKRAWTNRSWRWGSWLAAVGYVAFYAFITNNIAIPDNDELSLLPLEARNGFVATGRLYGPMAIWPDIEFYTPALNLYGFFSVGSVLLFISLVLLVNFAVALLLQNIGFRMNVSGRSAAPFAGTLATALSTNVCCCCAPALAPVFGLLLGGTTVGSLGYYLLTPTSPLIDLLVITNVSLLLVSTMLSTRSSCKLTGMVDRVGQQDIASTKSVREAR